MQLLVPRPPGEVDGDLKLTVLSFRDGLDDMLVRTLDADEQWVLIKVYANARIDVATNRSASAESGAEGAILGSLGSLSG